MRTIFVTTNPSNDELVCKNPMLSQLYAGLALVVLDIPIFRIAIENGSSTTLGVSIMIFALGVLLALTFTTRTLVLSKTGTSSFYVQRILGRKRLMNQFNSSSVTTILLTKRTRRILNLATMWRSTNLMESLLMLKLDDNRNIRFASCNTSPKKIPLDAGAKQIADFLGVTLTVGEAPINQEASSSANSNGASQNK